MQEIKFVIRNLKIQTNYAGDYVHHKITLIDKMTFHIFSELNGHS